MKSKEEKSIEPLLEQKWKKERISWIVYLVISFPTICIFILVLLAYLRKKTEFLGVKGLRDAKKDYALRDLVSKKVVFKVDGFAHIYSVYAMADMDCDGCAQLIYRLYTKPRPKYYTHGEQINYTFRITQSFPIVYKVALLHIAKRRGVTFTELMEFLDREVKKSTLKELKRQVETTKLSIPITKSYVLDKEPENKQSMVSSLPLDFKNDEIVACPHCGNMAEKNLMNDWLKEKSSCPICKELVAITDCPLVIIKD